VSEFKAKRAKYRKTKYRIDPKYREKVKQKSLEYYYKNKEARKLKNRLYKSTIRAKSISLNEPIYQFEF
jgi:hypothetical protein